MGKPTRNTADSRPILTDEPVWLPKRIQIAEGGCGVLGVICSVPIEGKFLLRPMFQMHNRGNGKGGGIAAAGFDANQLGVSQKILRDDYILQVAYLDPHSRRRVEAEFVHPSFRIDFAEKVPTVKDYRETGLEVKPPEVWRYFVRVDEDQLKNFVQGNGLEGLEPERAEDEFIVRNSFLLNKRHYASLGEKRAFVLSHGKDLIVLKIVGYAEQVLEYYKLRDIKARVWVGHQRYPTKGKVWHPGGSHPFIGLHDALVHNGDFANYYSMAENLKQRDVHPLFLTDTEVAALYWDLLTRVYRYPLEYAIEAIAPTTERDFVLLPEDKKAIYKSIQTTHVHGSPDGPWFFIIVRNDPYRKQLQLIGITDTSMLRPQVFALQEGEVNLGLVASERQAIDAMLESIAKEDKRIRPAADLYWYARGGSYTDGGSFVFTLDDSNNFLCTNKFGGVVSGTSNGVFSSRTIKSVTKDVVRIDGILNVGSKPMELFDHVSKAIKYWDENEIREFIEVMKTYANKGDREKSIAIETLTLLIDRRYHTGEMRRSDIVTAFEETLFGILHELPPIDMRSNSRYLSINWEKCSRLKKPVDNDQTLVIDACDFQPEGEEGLCQFLEKAYQMGWRKIIAYNFRGQRNFGAGLITKDPVRIDVYGNVGDCLAAFADGTDFYIHGSVQDSTAYCFRTGKLVIFGDAGKAFEYGAKGGITFVLGDLMDRPLVNAVGSATAVINGSCMDYMGESCMAARGLIILNGIKFNDDGTIVTQETPYPGGNLFPLAAASTVYLRDPWRTVSEDQLNGGEIRQLSDGDWERIFPLLKENERLFGIRVEELLTVDGIPRKPEEVYRKVVPIEVAALAGYEVGD